MMRPSATGRYSLLHCPCPFQLLLCWEAALGKIRDVYWLPPALARKVPAVQPPEGARLYCEGDAFVPVEA